MKLVYPALAVIVVAYAVCTPSVAGQEMPPVPKPGPEHKVLAQDVGTWNAVVEVFGPDGSPMSSKGVETNRMGCGGLCLISDFTGEMMPGQPFEGHGTTVYDATKKKYVGSWTDSMSQGLAIGESTHDPATNTITGTLTAPDPSGTPTTMKAVVQYKGDTRIFTLYAPGTGGKEMPSMRITYTRKP